MREIEVSSLDQTVASALLKHRGDAGLAAREPEVPYGAMELRKILQQRPEIRDLYQSMLAEELQTAGLQHAERLLRMADLQAKAYGGPMEVDGEVIDMPPDPMTVVKLSQEISRLMAEAKSMPLTEEGAGAVAYRMDPRELLESYLEDNDVGD